MEGLKQKKYLHTTRKRFDPISLIFSVVVFAMICYGIGSGNSASNLFDLKGVLVVCGGTFASILFQFDIWTFFNTIKLLILSIRGVPEKKLNKVQRHLDKAILEGYFLSDVREGEELSGELLNDIVYMNNNGMLFDEIDAIITAKVKDDLYERNSGVELLSKAATIAPALGLFGTVMGLIGVLKGLSNPASIGPSMSLALMTTAYGAGLASLVFNPLAGRLEYHNEVYIEFHRQILSKVKVLLLREERSIEKQKTMEQAA